MRGVVLDSDSIRADVEGINELVDGIPTLQTIKIHYTLSIPPGSREVVDRALSRHVVKCPTARSLDGAVAIEWTADITEQSVEPTGG